MAEIMLIDYMSTLDDEELTIVVEHMKETATTPTEKPHGVD